MPCLRNRPNPRIDTTDINPKEFRFIPLHSCCSWSRGSSHRTSSGHRVLLFTIARLGLKLSLLMKAIRTFSLASACLLILPSCTTSSEKPSSQSSSANSNYLRQTPSWSRDDLEFFLHGSMSTEVVPESVLRAFIRAYPDLFPTSDLSNFGLVSDPAFGWPVGFSRRNVPHLGGLSALGLNCAACHVAEIEIGASSQNHRFAAGSAVRILGVTSHFDAEAYFGAVTAATFRTGRSCADEKVPGRLS